MKILFPDTLDDFGLTVDRDTRNSGVTTRAFSMQDVAYALQGIETKVGGDDSGDANSLDYRVATIESLLTPGSANTVLMSNGVAPVWSSSLSLPGSLTVAGASLLQGTVDVLNALTIRGTADGLRLYRYVNAADATVFFPRKARGTEAAPTAVLNGDGLFYLSAAGFASGGSWVGAGVIQLDVDGAPTSTNVPGRWIFSTRDTSGTLNEVLRLDAAKVATFSGSVKTGDLIQATVASSGAKALGLESSATGNPNERTYLAAVQTSDGSQTTVHTIVTSSNAGYHVEAIVTGRRTAGGSDMASYHIAGTFRNAGGTLTQRGTTTVIHTAEDAAGFDANFAISGTSIQVRVAGSDTFNMQWNATIKITQV